MNLLNSVGARPQYSAADRDKRERDGVAHISKQFARYGLTTVHHEGGDLAAMQDVRARGDLKHRINYEASGSVLARKAVALAPAILIALDHPAIDVGRELLQSSTPEVDTFSVGDTLGSGVHQPLYFNVGDYLQPV
jgi:hypothetical protein